MYLMRAKMTGIVVQNIIRISGGRSHVGIITRDDHLRNVESKNVDEMRFKDLVANKERQRDKLEEQLVEIMRVDENEVTKPVEVEKKNPFTAEIEYALTEHLTKIKGCVCLLVSLFLCACVRAWACACLGLCVRICACAVLDVYVCECVCELVGVGDRVSVKIHTRRMRL